MLSLEVPLHCINETAIEFNIPAKLLISILQIEHGKVGKITKNTNGTYDIGPAQINSIWLPELKRHGITQYQVQFNPCINIRIAAWILAKDIANENNFLTGIGNYNSHTKQYNQVYYQNIRLNYTKLNLFLS